MSVNYDVVFLDQSAQAPIPGGLTVTVYQRGTSTIAASGVTSANGLALLPLVPGSAYTAIFSGSGAPSYPYDFTAPASMVVGPFLDTVSAQTVGGLKTFSDTTATGKLVVGGSTSRGILDFGETVPGLFSLDAALNLPFGARAANVCYATDPSFAGGADPTGTVDSTAAITAAIAHMASLGGGDVILPAGTYLHTSIQLGDGTATTQSTYYHVSLVGAGSGGAVTLHPSKGVTRLLWNGGVAAGPALKIRGPVVGVNLRGILFDGGGQCEDGISEIYMHGSTWHDVFTINFTRYHWFRTRWLTNPSGPDPFVEGSSSNVFINCGCSGGSVTAPSGTLTGLVLGGNPADPTDRTSANVSDPYNSLFLKCRFRFDGSDNSIAAEFRYTDSNVFVQCDFGGKYGIAVAQNPNFTAFPSALLLWCFPGGNAFTPAGQYGALTTIGSYVSNGGILRFEPLGEFVADPGIPVALYVPWVGGTDTYGSTLNFGGYRPQGYTLQACSTGVANVSASTTAFQVFGLDAQLFAIRRGELYLPGFDVRGTNIKLRFSGVIKTGSTPGTIRLQVLLGQVAVGQVLICDTQTIALSSGLSASASSWALDIDALVTGNTGGPTATVSMNQQNARVVFDGAVTNPGLVHSVPMTSGGSSSGIVTTAGLSIILQAAWSDIDATGNVIYLTGATYEMHKAPPNAIT